MDLVSPAEHLCYIRCTYCHTLLAVNSRHKTLDWRFDVTFAWELCFLTPRNLNICHEDLFVLQVGVPRRWLMDSVTVHCGHCNHLSFLNPRDVIQCLCPAGPQMGFQVHFPVHGTSF
ncbi:hypothetical protein BHE74_00043850 [Ensete ventricosum]|nr:hypothetical protein GW17_00053873 [Ensete ventricosum]RWW49951.1 hypothetical protein BHE74_00043850 [Ensete ventricosum]RZS23622.1 hypothetical protein BHM03_00056588 [Ensete ventricosum]